MAPKRSLAAALTLACFFAAAARAEDESLSPETGEAAPPAAAATASRVIEDLGRETAAAAVPVVRQDPREKAPAPKVKKPPRPLKASRPKGGRKQKKEL